MAVTIPTLPRDVETLIREINRDRAIEPTFGGDETLVQRLGTKHELVVNVPAIASAGCGPALIAALTLGKTAGALLPIPEPKVSQTGFGTPRINGAGQLGSSPAIDGLPAGKIIPAGKWLTVIISGRRYAYFTTASVTANGSGQAALPIYPMLRRSAPDNAVVELANPLLEGLVKMTERDVRRIGSMSFTFTVRERG